MRDDFVCACLSFVGPGLVVYGASIDAFCSIFNARGGQKVATRPAAGRRGSGPSASLFRTEHNVSPVHRSPTPIGRNCGTRGLLLPDGSRGSDQALASN